MAAVRRSHDGVERIGDLGRAEDRVNHQSRPGAWADCGNADESAGKLGVLGVF